MKTPEDNCGHLYDYQVCRTYSDLQQILYEVNVNGYVIVSVTQAPSGAYTVFFRRCVGG